MIFHYDYSEKACQDHTTLVIVNNSLNPKQTGLFADWYGQGRADSAPLHNFCLDSSIDLKFVKLLDIKKKIEKNTGKFFKMLRSAFLSTYSIKTRPSQEMP